MTAPINRISGSQETSAGGSYSGGSFTEHHKKKGAPVPNGDLIEISQEARNRSTGKSKKSLLECLKELLG